MQPNQPAITPAQIAAALVALIGPIAGALAALGVYTLTRQQQDALGQVVIALGGFAAVLVAADAHLRAARNKARAQIEAAKPTGTTRSYQATITGDAARIAEGMTPSVGAGVESWTTPPGVQVSHGGGDAKARRRGGNEVWYPKASKHVISGQEGGTQLSGRPKVVLHTTEGSSIAGAEGAYRASGGSAPHFTISPTSVHQHIPIDRSAYSLEHPAGTPETNRAGAVIQIEQVGFSANTADWPDSYYAKIADLVSWIHENAGVPRQQISNGIHADFTNPVRIPAHEWADWSGVCGHVHVPNNSHTDPGRGYHIGKVLP